MISSRTRAALAQKKAAGAKLGNRTNLAEAQRLGCVLQAARADNFAGNVLQIIREVQAGGAISLRAVAEALNARKVRRARGGEWSAVQVSCILGRAA
ncbi:hypothetical protein [Lichenibacterium dinghuense]|uniref:hypothetical protein n=1 Tax=Lichenibacterium dinghuense TaxID=2895977 RepID=UPI002814F88A|nr:hypothetical protein [Lichenibacterium sp. 6Y81]